MTDARSAPTNYTPMIVIAALVALIVNGALVGWILWVNAQRPLVTLSQPVFETSRVICPGQTLDYKFVLAVSKEANVDLTTSVESLSPQTTVNYTRFQRYAFDAKARLEIGRQWLLPPTYLDPERGIQVSWRPGRYVQRTTANIVGGRDGPAEIRVQFTVPNGCVN